MYALGYHIVSEHSAGKKFYTVLVSPSGEILVHYGSRHSTHNAGYVRDVGKFSYKDHKNLGSAITALKKTYDLKIGSREYDNLLINFVKTDLRKVDTEDRFFHAATAPVTYQMNDLINEFYTINPSTATVPLSSFSKSDRDHKINQYVISSVKTSVGTQKDNTTTATAAPAPKKAPRVYKKFITKIDGDTVRPNGENYIPRTIMGHTDIALLREFRKKEMYVRLAGSPGSGKTALAEAAFKDLITISGHGDMTVAHFVGTFIPAPDGTFKWSKGPLVKAMEEGRALFVDEGTRIPTEVLNILFSVMDGRNMLRIDDRPDLDIVHAKEGFYVIMGYNPDTLGARPLDEALVSRFRVQINVTTDWDAAETLLVPEVAIRIARNLEQRNKSDKATGGPGVWIPQMRELLTYRDLIDIGAGEEFALATLVASCPRQMDIEELQKAIKDVAKKNITVPTLGAAVK